MSTRISIGDEAPNFDLSSTEDALLTLRDEVPRKTVVLYLAADPETEQARRDLASLAKHHRNMPKYHARILAVSAAKMPVLKKLQAELKLPFPLLRDDRDFLSAYGVESSDGETARPALVVVNRRQRVLYMANPVSSVEDTMPEVEKLLAAQPSPTETYPKKLINRWVDRWVN